MVFACIVPLRTYFSILLSYSLSNLDGGVSASCRTISVSFEAVRGEYLSSTQRVAILSILQMGIYSKPYVWRIYICV